MFGFGAPSFNEPDEGHGFINHYECERCGTAWEDAWTATCDDDCPACGLTMSPTESEDDPDCECADCCEAGDD